jgi:hypothetical protein
MTRDIVNSDEKVARQQWRTHPALAAWIVEKFNIDLDVMAHDGNAIVPRFIGDPMMSCDRAVAVDAFAHRWAHFGRRIFLNPPFRCLKRPILVDRMLEAKGDGSTVVMLAPDNGDTRWFARLVDAGAAVHRFRGRPRYLPAGAAIDDKSGASFPSALLVLHPHHGPRGNGYCIPTWIIDAKTFEAL